MRHFSAAAIDAALDFPSLIAALRAAFAGDAVSPARAHHALERDGKPLGVHLLMTAWDLAAKDAPRLGVKIVNVFPGNNALGLPTIQGVYILQDGATGETLATMDGTRLTLWRTAAASALAATFLARSDATVLTLLGAGALAPYLARAHANARPIRKVVVWNHHGEKARRLADALTAEGLIAVAEPDLERAVRAGDIVSAATLADAPLIKGVWLRAGQHIDLVGAFTHAMREADDAALQRARVFIDTPAALHEGGDVAIALKGGAIAEIAIQGDLAALARGAPGRGGADEITLFKSVGAAIEDLAAASLVERRSQI